MIYRDLLKINVIMNFQKVKDLKEEVVFYLQVVTQPRETEDNHGKRQQK
jgi:hypothetical protein